MIVGVEKLTHKKNTQPGPTGHKCHTYKFSLSSSVGLIAGGEGTADYTSGGAHWN